MQAPAPAMGASAGYGLGCVRPGLRALKVKK